MNNIDEAERIALFSSVQAFLIGIVFGAWRIRFRSLLPIVLAHVFFNTAVIVSLKAQYVEATNRPHPKYTISKETTYITEPLRKDGAVDYVAVLDQRFRQGVTPENNAAVVFWKAVGPQEIIPEYRDKYFQMLGIPLLPEKGDYFVDLDDYANRNNNGTSPEGAKREGEAQRERWDQLNMVMKRPWSPKEFPRLARWLAANEKPLALVVDASKRPRRYDPLCCRETLPLIAVLLPAVKPYRAIARALCARAMLQLNDGKFEEAWEDLLTCHRLSRLGAQGPTLVEFFALSRDDAACAGDQALLQHAHLTASQIAKMRADLNRLPAMPRMADKIDVAERFTYLDNVLYYSRHGRASLVEIESSAESEYLNGSKQLRNTAASLLHYSAGTAVDWDIVLRMGNAWFDRIADAYRKPTRAAQREALRKLDEDFRKLKTTAEDTASLEKSMLGDPRKALSERLGQVILIMFSPSITLNVNCEDRATMTLELTKLAFALAAFRADHGAYPPKLADLAPKYVAAVPKDIFANSDLHYRLGGKGYLLYSVGVNGKDDGAKSSEDRKKGEDWDDLVVRIPAPTHN
jgi:hypothetical protein